MSNKKPAKAAKKSTNENPAESLDAVRDLLFGATTREFDTSLTALEQKLQDEIERANQSSAAALKALRTQHETQLRQAQEQNQVDLNAQTQTSVELETKVDGLFNGLGSDLTTVTSRLATTEAELRSQMQRSIDDIRSEMQRGLNRLEQQIAGEINARQVESVSRSEFINVMQSAIESIGGESAKAPSRAKAS